MQYGHHVWVGVMPAQTFLLKIINGDRTMSNASQILQEHVDIYNNHPDTHAKFAPSSAKRWCNCPGSIALSADEDDGGGNKYTAEGSLAHLICELVLKGILSGILDLDELVGDTYMMNDFEIEVTEEMAEACLLYSDTIYNDALVHGVTSNTNDLMSVEQRIYIVDGCNGTSDCNLAIPFDRIIVYDFKYGAGVPVDVTDNYQMKCYGVGAMNEFEKGGNSYLDTIELVIIQPRARHADGEVRRWEISREDILAFKVEIEECIKACGEAGADIKSGDWCRWCPAKHKCPALFEDSTEIAKVAFDAIDVGEDVLVAMTDVQMLDILDKADTILNFIKAVQAHAQARLMGGDGVGEYKLVQGRATRSWYDEDNVMQRFEEEIPGDELYTKKFVSPAQLEKVIKKELHVTLKEAKEMIVDYVDPGVGKISLAPGHDKRDAILLNAGEMFDEVEL